MLARSWLSLCAKEIELYNLTMISLGTEYKWKKDDTLESALFVGFDVGYFLKIIFVYL